MVSPFYFNDFRTWYDGLGGFYPPTGTQYRVPDGALALDRGEFSLKGGLTLEKIPAITFQYTHSYRDGDKSSTIWGPVHPNPPATTVRGLYPAFTTLTKRWTASR